MRIETSILAVASLVFAGSCVFFFLFTSSFTKELMFLKKNSLENGIRGKLTIGSDILFSGPISSNSIPVKDNFVIAKDLKYYRDEDSGWSWVKDYTNEFNVNCSEREIAISPVKFIIQGKTEELVNLEDKDEKTAGFIIGSVVTIRGKVIGESPLKVEASLLFGGEESAYAKALQKNSIPFYLIGLAAIAFASMFFIGALKAFFAK